jgi:putative oxidoreductase
MKEKLNSWESQARSVTRVVVGLLIALHGFRNVFGVLEARAGRRNAPPMALDMLGAAGGYIEMIGGILLLLGLLTVPVAVVLCVTTIAGYAVGPLIRGPLPIRNGGEEAVVYIAITIYYALNGAGAWSLDAPRKPKGELRESTV